MEEKLIVISIYDEIVDSFVGTMDFVNSSDYYINNSLEPVDVLEFEAFIYVSVKFG